MKIHIRFDESNAVHTHFTLFIGGQNCGQLCTGTEDAVMLHSIIANGCNDDYDEFVSSGNVWENK